MPLKTYKVPVVYQSWGIVEVEAESLDDLKQKLNDPDFIHEMPLPYEPDYVEDSYEIDHDSIAFYNPS